MSKKVILITGASSGIGRVTAQKLVEEGHIVYGSGRKDSELKAMKKEGIKALKIEMTDEKSLKKAVDKIIKEQQRIDVLFNNAGYGLYGAMEDIPMDDARQQFEVNLFGLARITQLVLPHMRKQKSGKIINTSSMGGRIYTPLGSWYHATKHALEGWSDCLRLELKDFGIDVVVIQPGVIETNFGNVVAGPLKKYSAKGPYKQITSDVIKSTQEAYESGNRSSSSPLVIANVVSKAIAAQKPKTRYVAGKYARPLMFMRKYFGDRAFDWGVLRTFRQ